MDKDSGTKNWSAKVDATISDLREILNKKCIPVLRGSLHANGVAIVDVLQLDAETLSAIPDNDSLCVLEDEVQAKNSFEDLHIYLRMGKTNTWVHYCLENPDSALEEDFDEDEPGWQLPERYSNPTVDDKITKILAVKVARSDGFGRLRNAEERRRTTEAILIDDPTYALNARDIWDIAEEADSIFRLGVLPSTTKLMSAQGKSISEVARALGVSKLKTEQALEAVIPKYIGKLLS